MNAFLTGSRAYGTPREDSDIDLVILTDRQNAGELWALSKDGTKLILDNVNVIALTNPEQFELWRKGTEMLKESTPVSRDEAVAFLISMGVSGGYA